MNTEQRAVELCEFLGLDAETVHGRLAKGFHFNHHAVAADFIDTNTDVNSEESLLNWYRTTDSYIWELTAYHLDEGFNYSGMCEGVANHLKVTGKKSVLCLGDGIGDLSLRCAEEGIATTYHDLEGSKTAAFAEYRFNRQGAKIGMLYTDTFDPVLGSRKFDAIVALDFFEHVVNVEEWVRACYKALKKGGAFMGHNAFGIGDAEHGNSIPMHLSVNNRFEWDWDPLLDEVGFIRPEPTSGWRVKP